MLHNHNKESDNKRKEVEDKLAAAEKLTRKLKTQLMSSDKKGASKASKRSRRMTRMTKKNFGSTPKSRMSDLVGGLVEANRVKRQLEHDALSKTKD